MFSQEVNEVYKKLDDLFKLKAKRMVKGSGLNFERLSSAVDLVKGHEFYILVIDGRTVTFKDKRSLFPQLIRHCLDSQNEKQRTLDELEYHKQHDLYFNDVAYDPLMEQYGYEIDKLKTFVLHLHTLKETSTY